MKCGCEMIGIAPKVGRGAVNMKMTVAGDVLLLRPMIHGKGFEPLTRCV